MTGKLAFERTASPSYFTSDSTRLWLPYTSHSNAHFSHVTVPAWGSAKAGATIPIAIHKQTKTNAMRM
jgi:hypothetical protein